MLSLSRFQTLRSLRHRNFRLMVIGALLSNAGDFMQNVAQSWLVWHLTRSAFLLGVVGFFLDALSFLALILTLILMELPAWDGSSRRAGLWNEIAEGYRYLRSNSQMFAIVMLSYVVASIGAPYATFVPVFATNILHVGP